MCSTSNVNEMIRQTTSAAAAPKELSAVKLRHSREDFFLVDIREPDEIADALPDDMADDMVANAHVPMGKLLNMAINDEQFTDEWKDKKVVLLCNSGYRSSIAAAELQEKFPNGIMALSRGLLGLSNPSATVPDFLVVLATKSDPEKITLALNACAVAASNGQTVVLCLMGDGVCTFLRKGSNKEEPSETSFRVEQVFIGEPFQPTHVLLQKYIATGNGVVLGCTSCVKSRKIEFGSDLLDFVQPMQMPDLLRMLGECKTNLQFM